MARQKQRPDEALRKGADGVPAGNNADAPLARTCDASPEAQIAAFTREDYQGAAPYEWLYAFRDNAFMLERLRGLMLDDARRKGVRNAGMLWKSYLEAQVSMARENRLGNVTEFTGQPLELRCGDYRCTDSGVMDYSRPGMMVQVCPHPIMPVKRLRNIETGEVKMEIAYRRGFAGGGWMRAVFDKEVLNNARGITTLAKVGIGVTSESAGGLVRYLSEMEDKNYDTLPEEKTVGRLGWIRDFGFSPYVENLRYDGDERFREAFGALHPCGSWQAWLDMARRVRAGGSVPARIALAVSFASPLVARLGALPFILHLWGGSGTGKSVAMLLAASVWGNPEIGRYVKTTRSTDVGFEEMAAFCGNLPLCLDELQLIQDRKDFDTMVYGLCEGVGKVRGAKGGGIRKTLSWRNAIITTGERPSTTARSKAGAVNRVMEVECTEKLFKNPRQAYQFLSGNYGHAGPRYVQALEEHADAVDTLKTTQQAYYELLSGCGTDKQVLTASLILAADALADMLLFEDGNSLTTADLRPYLVTEAQSDTNARAYEWACDWVASNQARFTSGSWNTGEVWGKMGNGEAYIIKSVFEKWMTDAGYNVPSFLSWADRKGLIEVQGGRRTKVARIQGSLARCVVLTLPFESRDTDVSADREVQEAFAGMKG